MRRAIGPQSSSGGASVSFQVSSVNEAAVKSNRSGLSLVDRLRATFHEDDVAPDVVHLAELLTPTHGAEAHLFVEANGMPS